MALTNSPFLNMALTLSTGLCLIVSESTKIEMETWTMLLPRICTVLSFVVILVSNWNRFKIQLKKWFK